MVTYTSCTHASMNRIYEAFKLGFSDYAIRLDLDQDAFAARFFGPEGNTPDLSFIALDEQQPIGLILGGIRPFDGLRTMRCGALCIAPDYRGQGISHQLFHLHKAAALDAHCQQLFLEVLSNNARAIKFYEKQGYQAAYTLKYYTLLLPSSPFAAPLHSFAIKEISHSRLEAFRQRLDCHINWQNDTPFYASNNREAILAAYDPDQREIAYIAMGPNGKLDFLWVDPQYRNQGLARDLLLQASAKQQVDKVTACVAGQKSFERFLIKNGFQKQPIEQFEMVLPFV